MTARVNLSDIDSHPIARQFYIVALAMEQLPAGPNQTKAQQALADLKRKVQDDMNGR